jgi:hypothetical protein
MRRATLNVYKIPWNNRIPLSSLFLKASQNDNSSESMSRTDLEADDLARRIFRPDSQAVVANNAEKIYEFWKALHTRTTIPSNSPDLDIYIMRAFQFLDGTMLNRELPHQLSRLSHVALTKMVGSLKKAVAANRRQGKVESRSGYRNAAIVMDLYLNAQELVADRVRAKRHLNRRMQTSRRWTELARGCPLLLVTHADAAESLVLVIFSPHKKQLTNNVGPIVRYPT